MQFLDEVIVLRTTTGNFDEENEENEITETNYSDIGVELAEEAIDLCGGKKASHSNKKPTKEKDKKIDKYEAAIAEIKQMAPSNIFETFSATVALQLEQIHQLDVAEAFSCMQEIQNLIGNKITKLLKAQSKAKNPYCHTCSEHQFNIANSEDHHSNTPPFSPFDFDEPAIYNYPFSPSLTSNSTFKNIKASSSSSTNTTRPSTSTPINIAQNRAEYNSSHLNLTEICTISPPSTSNFKTSNTLFLTASSTNDIIPQKPLSLSSKPIDFNSKENRSTYNFPESKRIKILEDITIKHSKSSILKDAMDAAEIAYYEGDDVN